MTSANPTGRTIDDESLAMLLEEVSAMASASHSIVPGLADLDDASMGKLGRAANAVRSSLAQGRSAAESIASLSGTYSAPIRVAMETMARTGSVEPVRETARLIREANDNRRHFWLSSINPAVNIVVAATILFFVMPWILISLSEAELIKTAFSPTVDEIIQAFAQDFFLAAFGTLAVVGLVLVILYWALSRTSKDADALRNHSTFCRWLAIGVQPFGSSQSHSSGELETGRVIAAAIDVVGSPFTESWGGVVDRINAGSTSAASLEIPAETPEPVTQVIVDLVAGKRASESIALDLQRLSELYSQKSRRYRKWWIEILPRWVSWALIIAIIVILLRAILIPLFQVVSEVVS